MKQRALIVCLVCAFCACSSLNRKQQIGDVAVSLNGQTLSHTQLQELTSQAPSPEDSALMADAYIRQWAGDVLFYDKASKYKDPEIEELVEAYRRQLYVKRYEDKLVNSKMDQTLDMDTIQAYYEKHPELFRLHTSIVQGVILTIPEGAPNLQKLKGWLQHPMQEIEKIEKYAYQYATGYELFVDRWKTSNQLMLKMPIAEDVLNASLSSKQQIEVTDSTQTYILQITDKRLPGELMPLELAEPEIRKLMLAERRTDFIQQQKDALYEEAEKLFRIKRE